MDKATLEKIVNGSMTALEEKGYRAGRELVEKMAKIIARKMKVERKNVLVEVSEMTCLDLCVFMGGKTLGQAIADEAAERVMV